MVELFVQVFYLTKFLLTECSAMVMYHLMISAFPKAVYNADLIQTWNNEIGSAIGVRGLGQMLILVILLVI
jgi:predicted Zn-dependent protease